MNDPLVIRLIVEPIGPAPAATLATLGWRDKLIVILLGALGAYFAARPTIEAWYQKKGMAEAANVVKL